MRFWMFSKPEVTGGWVWEEIKGVKISCTTVQNMHAKCEDHPWHLHFLNKIMSSCKCEIISSLFGNHHDGTMMVSSNQLQVFGKAKTIFLKTIGFGIWGMCYGTKGMYYEDQSLQTWEKMYSFWYVFARWMIRYVEDKQYPTISRERSHEANVGAKSNDD